VVGVATLLPPPPAEVVTGEVVGVVSVVSVVMGVVRVARVGDVVVRGEEVEDGLEAGAVAAPG